MAPSKHDEKQTDADSAPFFYCVFAYISLISASVLSAICNLFNQMRGIGYMPYTPKGYAPIIDETPAFFGRYLFGRISDCWDRPISSKPGASVDVMDRTGSRFTCDLELTGTTTKLLNLGSYNYLGFADGKCTPQCLETLSQYGVSTTTTRVGAGSTEIHRECEQLVARYLNKEDAIIFGMGYATNSTNLPNLVGKGGLIISDSLNHASLVVGIRSSDAAVKVFKHNDPADLERVLKEAFIQGQPRTGRPWSKILIVVEGIYSMEGNICRLPEIIAIKKKYKAYLYVDEAHSIGALGKTGRGVTDYWGIDTSEVDILMGTFTKSFGSAGGYLASSKAIIDQIRSTSYCAFYDTSMSTVCIQQVISSLKIIIGEDGTDDGHKRLTALRENSNYFRRRLKEEGFRVIGHEDSPIVPVMIYMPAQLPAFSRLCYLHGIGVVIAGYPATPLLLARARFCISAAHTIPELEEAIQKMVKIGDLSDLRYDKHLAQTKDGKKTASSPAARQTALAY
eukprot:TRINITY_DN14607_c0_g1_i1.p1 TRINITY_DN14607_c0_g1~~TRINITY_DN14607_c0_g1_i1.p1  ORF type:complete len:509 (-),score=107.00 TRINITY_DN14607_c0_g1_i1:388-1914(-)